MTTITLKGTPIHTSGHLPPKGNMAPDFTLTKTDLGEVHLKNYTGTRLILNIFPSLDTPTCSAAMQEFNKIAEKHPDTLCLCVSADLPFAQKRFCTAQHLNNVIPVSVFRHPGFGNTYGVIMTDGPLAGLLSRAVVIIDKDGTITYTQQVKELSEEPNYDEILAALKV